jgi:hypothetical protein
LGTNTKGHRVKSTRRKITPAEATEMLEKTNFQRPLNHAFCERLAEQIKAGKWVCNGETIVLDRAGRVLDGQHRLWACFMAEKPIESFVVEDADSAMFATYDTGRARDAYDIISIEHNDQTDLTGTARRMIATAAKMAMLFRDGRYVDNRASARDRPTNQDVLDWTRENPEIIEQGRTFSGMGRWPLPGSMCLAVFHVVVPGFPDCMDSFFRPLQAGTALEKGSPVLLLRDRVSVKRTGILSAREQLALLVKAWNLHALGDRVQFLVFQSGTEAFPTLVTKPGVRPTKVRRAGPLTGNAAVLKSRQLARTG